MSAPLVHATPPAWRKQASSPVEPPQQQLGSVLLGAILHYKYCLAVDCVARYIIEGMLTAAKAVDVSPATRKKVFVKCMLLIIG